MLIYRRYCNKIKIPKKKQMDLCTFQSRLAKALLLGKKEKKTPKRGRPSTITNDEAVCKKRNVVANSIPCIMFAMAGLCIFSCLQTNQSLAYIALVVIPTFPVQNAKFNSVWLKTEMVFCNFIVNK